MTPQEGYYLPSRQLVSQADQSMIERPDVPRSKFSGTWNRLTTFDAGYVVPFMVDEILPGDHMKYNVTAFVRMATLLFPMYSNQRVDTFFFFVPTRLVWDSWRQFMGQQASPADSIAFTIPQVVSPAGGFPANSIWDHMGLPVAGQITAGQTISVSVLPLRCYNRIWNEWFRDENSVNGLVMNTGAGPDATANYTLARRMKSHDYFTSALPWPQKFTAPSALGAQAPVTGIGVQSPATNVAGTGAKVGVISPGQPGGLFTPANETNQALIATATNAGNVPLSIYADLSDISVNVLRQSFMVQALLERDARGGTRYTEIVKSHFGVTSPDARLQRPEYIGGGSTPLNVTPIAQTATGGGGVGALAAAGSAAGGHHASYAATEHGYILGLINVRTELSYSQGLHRMWTRSTRFDFYFPALAQLGEQAVLRQEIYCTGVDVDDALVFGYQERWQEYRQRMSEVTGMFRPTTAASIDQWHLSQEFTAAPVLGATFLQEDPPMARVLAAGASTNMQYLADIMIHREAVRPLPAFGTPALLGRF